MVQRRYGPTRGAGTAIIEKEGDKPVEAGALGWIGYGGIFEKGEVGKLIQASSNKAFALMCGGLIPDSLAPDCALNFYDVAVGAGGGFFVRVTDGNELESEVTLYARRLLSTPMGTLKAKNGGRWAGKKNKLWGEMALISQLTETELDTGVAMKTDEWKGGVIELPDVLNTQYVIISNDDAGVITVASDQTMLTDYGAGADLHWYLTLENGGKALSYELRDGVESPTTEFGLDIYVDGALNLSYPNLSTDPTSSRYWINLINNDGANYQVEVVDLWTGAHVADVRPANHYGVNSTIAAALLTVEPLEFDPAATGDGDGTCVLGTTTDIMVQQVLTLTFTSPTAYDVVSDVFGAIASGAVAAPFAPDNKWVPPFTLTAGTSAWEIADVATLTYKPLVADSLIEGRVYPDKSAATREYYRIIDNTHKTITVQAGSDMTNGGARTGGEEFMVVAPLEMVGGRDGIADLVDADYENQAWSPATSPFNQIQGKNVGLVKFATPGVYSTAVQQAGKAYADAKNHQYRYEVDPAIVTESAADAYVNDTLGRSDFAVVAFPSYGYVSDPEAPGEGKLKLVPLTGKIHGREARIAVDYDGYHKAEAGVDATLPGVLKLPTGDTILDEEYLNPLGLNVIKKLKGNFVIWGDRTLWVDPTWKWKHQRELVSYYEQTLEEAFDWIIYMINDKETQDQARGSLKSFFLPEWRKRALRGNTFDEAATIKIDDENNTSVTQAAGDMHAEVALQLADTVERFVITIGKMGIFESVV
ncbi:MAG: hypothetical protein DRJ65_22025 [Acidobacteria bacterium]|nr:MAG: hypothetical protein DRJ65_22025 [Acidobacteriota bacterium]